MDSYGEVRKVEDKEGNRIALFRVSFILTVVIWVGGIGVFGPSPYFTGVTAFVALVMTLACAGFVISLKRGEMQIGTTLLWVASGLLVAGVKKFFDIPLLPYVGYALAASVMAFRSLGYRIKWQPLEKPDILATFCWVVGTLVLITFTVIFRSH